MNVEYITKTWEQKDLKPIEKFVLMFLASFSDESGYIVVSYNEISAVCLLSPSTIKKYIKILDEKNMLSVDRFNNEDGGTASNGYFLMF